MKRYSSSLATLRYSVEPRTRKYVKRYRFSSFARNLSEKYGTQLFYTATKKVAHKAGECIGNKTLDAVAMKPVEKIINLPDKREDLLIGLRGVL